MRKTFDLEIDSLIKRLEPLRQQVLQAEEHFREELAHVYPGNQHSARNLVHYLGLRRHDIRQLQEDLRRLALSSLGRLESHVMPTLDALLALLHRIAGQSCSGRPIEETFAEFDLDSDLLERHAVASLGKTPPDRSVRIMVTMPSEAASDPALVHNFLKRGMNIMRVNCAHDGPEEWRRMVENLARARNETGHPCKIAFDLAGPKFRTGPISPGPGVVRWKPERNHFGQVTTPAAIAFHPAGKFAQGEEVFIPVLGSLLEHAQPGDIVQLQDTRGRERTLNVVAADSAKCVCTNDRTGYVVEGTRIRLLRDGKLVCEDEVAPLPAAEQVIWLSPGDDLLLTPAELPGKPAEINEDETVYRPAQIGCSLPAIFTDARPGQRVIFDDGKIEGLIRAAHKDGAASRVDVKITHAAKGRARLRSEKGINLPDTKLKISALTPKDRQDLEFVTEYGDLVSLSFVRRPEDVLELIHELDRLQAAEIGLILKIENRAAVEDLPKILLAAMGRPTVAVMVARGDLGVEVGFERMAEIQEELLWICEAGHVPVIWATQVLESLVKRGLPSRAEITDAAMSGRAECVMLNKGPNILRALDFLCDVLRRMEEHQTKKSALMRRLRVAELAWK